MAIKQKLKTRHISRYRDEGLNRGKSSVGIEALLIQTSVFEKLTFGSIWRVVKIDHCRADPNNIPNPSVPNSELESYMGLGVMGLEHMRLELRV